MTPPIRARTPEPLLGPPMLPAACRLIIAGRAKGPVPAYGSVEWHRLPVGSARWLAAVLIAAECWRTYTDPAEVAWRLRTELEHQDDEPAAWPPEVVAMVHRVAGRPSYATLCDRRGEPEKAARARWHEARMAEVIGQ